MQRQVEKVARTAGRVEHGEPAQPFEEGAQRSLCIRALPRLRRWRPGRLRPLQRNCDPRLRRLPFGKPGAEDNRFDDPHDLVAISVMRAELGTLVRVQPALEQRAQDRRVDLRPVERRRPKRRLDLRLLQRQCGIVVEQSAVEPGDGLEPDIAAFGHRSEQLARQLREAFGPVPRMFEHPREHAVGKQAHILREHAEHKPVHKMRHRLRRMAALSQRLRQRREGRRCALGECLPALAGAQTLGIGHGPLQLVPRRCVRQILQCELVRRAHAVGPVGADAEPRHVGDDQQRRIVQRQRILPKLVERRVEVGVFALVLPGKAVALPHVGPTVAARVLARAALEAVGLAGRVGLRRRRLAEQPAQVDEVLLAPGALLQRRRPPLRDERPRRHAAANAAASLPNGVSMFK